MRLKFSLLILIPFSILVGCQRQTVTTTMLPEIKPSIIGLAAPEIDQPTADAIRQHIGPFLKSNPYKEYGASSQLLLYLVSSGEFGQVEITLAGGETYQADVIYAFALMSNQRVLIVPVMVGLTLQDDRYAYFSETYSFEADGGITTTSVNRQTALADAQARLPRGRIFRLLAYGMATRQELNWKKCPSISFYPPEICPIGELVEKLNPNQTKAFVLRLADDFPTSWLLVGWFFQEFAPEELVPDASIQVPLPIPPQP